MRQASLRAHADTSASVQTAWGTCNAASGMYILPYPDQHKLTAYRYCNVDYVFLSSLIGTTILYLLATYDIACQFFVNFWDRMNAMPPRLRLKIPRDNISTKVPKAHLEVHKTSCHGLFSLNWLFGAGRTDGEGVERLWSWLNKAAPSVKEMGPWARKETIDDFCLFAGWQKTINLGMCTVRLRESRAHSDTAVNYLSRRLLDAIRQARLHIEEFEAFSARLRERFPQQIAEWEQTIIAWERDNTLPCPYLPTVKSAWLLFPRVDQLTPPVVMTLNEVRQAVAEEEARVEQRAALESLPNSSPSSFIAAGLEIESQQYVCGLLYNLLPYLHVSIGVLSWLIEKLTRCRTPSTRYPA